MRSGTRDHGEDDDRGYGWVVFEGVLLLMLARGGDGPDARSRRRS
jgi:hypothetical protein